MIYFLNWINIKKVAIDWEDCKVEDVYASDDEDGRKYGPIGYNVLPAKEVGRIIDFISCSYNVYGKCPKCKKCRL
ncbi:MAG: hypothetical protein PHX08_20500 [Lachnospiraceae bacterium]|nr:hypothetical protein [Lachnospiraceae bacterium]